MVGGRLTPNQGVHLPAASRLQATPSVGRRDTRSPDRRTS